MSKKNKSKNANAIPKVSKLTEEYIFKTPPEIQIKKRCYYIKPKGNSFLIGILRDYLETLYDDDIISEYQNIYPIESFFGILDILEMKCGPEYPFDIDFYDFVKNHLQQRKAYLESLSKTGRIGFEDIGILIEPGMEVVLYDYEKKIGAIVESVQRKEDSFFGPSFTIRYNVIISDGKNFYKIRKEKRIRWFSGTYEISKFLIHPISKEEKESLCSRGQIFLKYAIGNHYCNYTGNLIQRSWWDDNYYLATGRVMIDSMNYKRFNPDNVRHLSFSINFDDDDDDKTISEEEIREKYLFMTWPFVLGFSMYCKKWGELDISTLHEISFREDAFDLLVIDKNIKKLIRSLVENSGETFSDIISGKGGGCIMLLHGSPGVGKTLTAEAVSELLHKPLYSVTVGELGTDPGELEENLRMILELASSWSATILIDEADIFLERRTDRDIVRNAMVGVFLRLLEYHQGVLFLTTNRAKIIDEAFMSRISLAIKYRDLDEATRMLIWKNLLVASKLDTYIDENKIQKLATYPINGRQIKNSIRLVMSVAKAENRNPEAEDIEKIISHSLEFIQELD